MPAPLVSPWLFNAQALAAETGLPHLQPGNHLRIAHSPLLGLPDTPFVVWRAQTSSLKGIARRSEAIWIDSREAVRRPPFTITPDNPVTARLVINPGEACLWAEIIADPSGKPPSGEERPGPFLRPRPIPFPGRRRPRPFPGGRRPVPDRIPSSRLGGPGLSRGRITLDRYRIGLDIRDRIRGRLLNDLLERIDLGDLLDNGSSSSGMRVEAHVTSPHGPAFSAARNQPRFAFAAPGIVELRITGRGTVFGLRWMEASDVQRLQFHPWRALNLPHEGGPRYVGPIDAYTLSKDRVLEAAPKRRPLQDTLGARPPASAPAQTPAEELDRVLSLADPLRTSLDRLINDLSRDERSLTGEEPLRDEKGNAVGTMRLNLLNQLLQATLDPGVAEYLGYMTVDRELVETESRYVFYHVEGYFHHRPRTPREMPGLSSGERAFEAMVSRLPSKARISEPDAMIDKLLSALAALRESRVSKGRLHDYAQEGPFLRLGCLAVADRGAPPLPPPAPLIEAHGHVGWMPAVPPDALREVRLDVAEGLIGGLLAGEKAGLPGGSPASLNAVNADGYHLPLSLSLESDDHGEVRDPEPGQGFISDRQASQATIRYSLAQQDRFGRWSDWVQADNRPGPHPRPPRPVFQALYEMPAIAEPMPAGHVRLKVQVPEPDGLAPGARLLQGFEVYVEDRTTRSSSRHSQAISTPNSPPAELSFTVPAPALSPTESRKLRLIARWRDVQGTASVDSEPVIVTLHDPRPPEQLPAPDTLLYAARPDVQGRSMVEHRWSPMAGQEKVAVYYSDENRLKAFINSQAGSDPSAQAALTALEAADNPAARATVFRSNAGLFTSHLFERLDVTPETMPGGEMRFQHAVSGSLRLLSFYRLSAETAAGSRVPLETLPLIVFGVPNSEPPAKPTLSVRPDPGASSGYAALAEVRVVPGMAKPVRLRLRRSVQSGSNPATMPEVGQAPIPSDVEGGFLHGSLVDNGPLRIAPGTELKPWVRYFWVAEVQGPPEPGSTVAGRWSLPSDPVSLALTPPGPPGPVNGAEARGSQVAPGVFEDVELRFDCSHALNGGEFGSYRLRVYRLRPEEPQQMLAEHSMAGDGPFAVSGMDASEAADQAPVGTIWKLVLLDPLGRSSAAVAITGVTPR